MNTIMSRLLIVGVIAVWAARSTDAISGGSPVVDQCQFPGLAVVMGQLNQILCTGVIVADTSIYLPVKCSFILRGILSRRGSIEVNNQVHKWVFPASTTPYPAEVKGGLYILQLSDKLRSVVNLDKQCTPSSGVLYDGSEELDTTTCQLAGYGADTNDGAKYNPNNLKTTALVKSTSAPCCSAISDSLTDREKGVGFFPMYSFNCVTATGAPCGLGDIGAPVMCSTKSGKRVTIGLTASSPCLNNGLFLIHDVTGDATNTKFGIK